MILKHRREIVLFFIGHQKAVNRPSIKYISDSLLKTQDITVYVVLSILKESREKFYKENEILYIIISKIAEKCSKQSPRRF